MRKLIRGPIVMFILIFILAGPSLAAQASREALDQPYQEQVLSIGRYDERGSLTIPERPLGFEAEIVYDAAIDSRKSTKNPAYLRLIVVLASGALREQVALRPGERKSGVIRLMPGQQLRAEAYCGQYTTLLIKNGADIKCKLRWPQYRFSAQEQNRRYGFNFSFGGWAEVERWVWDFGDGKRAEGAQAAHVYRGAGRYRVKVYGYHGGDPIQNYERELIVPEIIEVAPEVGPLEGHMELKVRCRSGLSAHYGEQAECMWDFGDGAPAVSGDEAEHLYRREGLYVLTLTARQINGGYSVQRTWSIKVKPITITTRAQFNLLEGPIPLRIEGTAQPRVKGGPVDLACRWDFGDGNFAEGARAVHYYGEAGQYQLLVSLVDRLHPELVIPPVTYTVRATPPTIAAAPLAAPQTGPAPLTVQFLPHLTVKGYPVELQYRWDFGDGSSAREQTPIHTFKANGEYDVRLLVVDAIHKTQAEGRVRISVRLSEGLTVRITADPRTGRSPLAVAFHGYASGAEAGAVLEYEWDFGDNAKGYGQSLTHTYQRPGEYRAILTVRDIRPGGTGRATAEMLIEVN